MQTTEKLTTEALRQMQMGEIRAFRLPKQEPYLSRAAATGKSLAYRVQREMECRFTATTDFDNAMLILTKRPRQ